MDTGPFTEALIPYSRTRAVWQPPAPGGGKYKADDRKSAFHPVAFAQFHCSASHAGLAGFPTPALFQWGGISGSGNLAGMVSHIQLAICLVIFFSQRYPTAHSAQVFPTPCHPAPELIRKCQHTTTHLSAAVCTSIHINSVISSLLPLHVLPWPVPSRLPD